MAVKVSPVDMDARKNLDLRPGDTVRVWQKIKDLVPVPLDVFIIKASKKNDPYEEIGTHMSEDVGKKITDLNIKGLQAFKERWRFYPGGSGAAHLIGLVAFKENELGGRYGLEKFYDDTLSRGGED